MNEENTKQTINYIFYLQTKSELDNSYYLLADALGKININLLPINSDDLKIIDRNKKHYVIVVRNDLSSTMVFNQMRKTFLDAAIMNGKVALFDISSFSEIDPNARFSNKNVYRYFQLPQNLSHVAMSVAVDYFRHRNAQVEWPGGKRSKLPTEIKET